MIIVIAATVLIIVAMFYFFDPETPELKDPDHDDNGSELETKIELGLD